LEVGSQTPRGGQAWRGEGATRKKPGLGEASSNGGGAEGVACLLEVGSQTPRGGYAWRGEGATREKPGLGEASSNGGGAEGVAGLMEVGSQTPRGGQAWRGEGATRKKPGLGEASSNGGGAEGVAGLMEVGSRTPGRAGVVWGGRGAGEARPRRGQLQRRGSRRGGVSDGGGVADPAGRVRVAWGGRDAGKARPRRGQLQRRGAEGVAGLMEVGSQTPRRLALRSRIGRKGRDRRSRRGLCASGDPAGRVRSWRGEGATREKPGLGEASSNKRGQRGDQGATDGHCAAPAGSVRRGADPADAHSRTGAQPKRRVPSRGGHLQRAASVRPPTTGPPSWAQ
jgi:hypothetical protein